LLLIMRSRSANGVLYGYEVALLYVQRILGTLIF